MLIDVFEERGLNNADYRWGDSEECRFPLFDFMAPMSLEWMYMVYIIMALGETSTLL